MNIPTSSDAQSDPRARKYEYIVIVNTNIRSKLVKNCDAVRARFAMLRVISGPSIVVERGTYKYTTKLNSVTWINTRGISTTT